jgi:predicted RNA-binding Zn-ribbon protein involved in translation (DUF1610 family)
MEQTSEAVQENAEKRQIDTQGEEQDFLRKLIKKGVLELKPALNKVGVHYAEAEETWKNADSTQVKGILQSLEKKGALKSQFIDRVLTCPDCGSPEVYTKYTCPKCDSLNVEYTELLEHMKCGYIGSNDKFTKGSSLVCPKCQTQLTDEALQYRVIGNCYQCEKCGYRFDKPDVIHICQKCGRNLKHQEAKYIKIFAYKITDETLNTLKGDLPILETIKKTLSNKGFKVQLHQLITGTSGVEHTFDVLAEKNETRIIIDISITGKKNDIVSLFGKKLDVNPTKALIIDLSNSDELTQLGKAYNITVFKTADTTNLSNFLETFQVASDSKENQKTKWNTSTLDKYMGIVE